MCMYRGKSRGGAIWPKKGWGGDGRIGGVIRKAGASLSICTPEVSAFNVNGFQARTGGEEGWRVESSGRIALSPEPSRKIKYTHTHARGRML